ncbi:hypothetical protein D918_05750 [Trichuris suis]|nr:hypothetical protein D918_05750 [Trichuris suis]
MPSAGNVQLEFVQTEKQKVHRQRGSVP